jgi:hypothetical protein
MVLFVVLANVTAGLGLGAGVLRILGLDKEVSPGEHWVLSFAIGCRLGHFGRCWRLAH